MEQHANPVVLLIQYQQGITPKWMQVATSSIVTGQKPTRTIHTIITEISWLCGEFCG
jgi:hypothetical protein